MNSKIAEYPHTEPAWCPWELLTKTKVMLQNRVFVVLYRLSGKVVQQYLLLNMVQSMEPPLTYIYTLRVAADGNRLDCVLWSS